MPHDKNPKKLQIETRETGKDTPPQKKSHPETLPSASELAKIKEKEKHVKEETTTKTSEVKRDILEADIVGPDKTTAEKILKLVISKSPFEQNESYERLKVVSCTFLPKLFDHGFTKNTLEILKNFSTLQIDSSIQLNAMEKMAIKKLKEMADSPFSSYLADHQKKWQSIVAEAYAVYKKSAQTRDYLMSSKNEQTSEQPWLLRKIKEHPVVATVILAAGAYGIYEIFFDDEEPQSGKKESSIIEKLGLKNWKGKLLTTALLGSLAVGGLIGPEKINDIIKKIINLSEEKIDKALAMVKDGQYLEAIKTFFMTEMIEGKGKEALTWLDEKINFSGLKKNISKFCTEHNITLPDWIKSVDLSEIAKDLGIEKGNEKTWIEYAVAGGGALLLYKWAGKKGILLNAGIFLFVVREGKDSFGGKLLHGLAGELDQAKNALLAKTKGNVVAELLINDTFENFSLQNGMDNLLEWLKEHPVEGMAIMNGAWICRGIILRALTIALKLSGQIVVSAIKNPTKTAIVTALAGMTYLGRRTLVVDLIDLLYEDSKSSEALQMLAALDKILGIDRSQAPEFSEVQGSAFLKSLTEDPLAALEEATTIENYKKGNFTIGVTVTGAVILLLKGASIPIQLTKLSFESLKSLSHIYSPENDDTVLMPTIVAGVETYLFGSAAIEGFRAYRTVIKSAETNPRKFWRALKSLVPGSKEWFFVMRSSLSGPLIIPLFKPWESIGINRIQEKLEHIAQLAKRGTPPFDEIEKISRELISDPAFNEDIRHLRKNLTGTRFGYEAAMGLNDVQRSIDGINEAAKIGNIHDVEKLTRHANLKLENLRNGARSMLSRLKMLMAGNFSEAFKLADAGDDMRRASEDAEQAKKEIEAVKPLEMKGNVFRKADGSFKLEAEIKADADKLRQEIDELDDLNPLKKTRRKELLAMEAFLDTRKATNLKMDSSSLEKLDDTAKAAKLESMAMQLEAAEKGLQSRFNAEVEKIVREAKSKNIPLTAPAVMEQLEKLDNEITIPFAKQKQAALELLLREHKALPGKFKTPALNAQIRHAIEGVDGTLMTRICKGAKGRGKMMVLMGALVFATDQLIHRNDPERDLQQILSDLGPDFGQLFLDCLPIVGTFSNYYSAFSGKEIVTERDVSSAWNRTSNVLWGTVGLVGDVITVLGAVPSGGTDIAANVAIRLAKQAAAGSKVAAKALKLLPRIEKIADRMGGWVNFAKKLKEYMGESSKVLKGMRTIQKVSMAAGTAMMVGGIAYSCRYAFVDNKTELEIPPEIMNTDMLPSISTDKKSGDEMKEAA